MLNILVCVFTYSPHSNDFWPSYHLVLRIRANIVVFRYTRMLFTPVCSSVLCYCKKLIEGEKVNKPASDKGTYMYVQCNVLSGVKSFCSCYTL